MPLMLSRILMLVVGVVLALPPGWCCFGKSGCCQASRERQQPESAKAPQEAGDCCHCCQSAPQEDHTSPPVEGPCCGSNSKAKICSCVRPPANKADTGSHVFPDLPAVVLAPVAHAPGSPCYTIALLTERYGADPPLNLLHCVWNC